MVQAFSRLRRSARMAVVFLTGWLALASAAQAQSMSTNSASFNAGFGRTAGEENRPIDVNMGDVNGNITVINGVITGAASGSVFASASASGVGDIFAGAGGNGASASAIGNNLSVVTQGNNNTVIVTSVQSNTGNVSATTNVNGKP